VNGLFDDRVRAATERLACPILQMRMEISPEVVALNVDVVEYTPGMAQSGGACVVRRQLWGGNQGGIRDMLYMFAQKGWRVQPQPLRTNSGRFQLSLI
jgi:hypothetical protein